MCVYIYTIVFIYTHITIYIYTYSVTKHFLLVDYRLYVSDSFIGHLQNRTRRTESSNMLPKWFDSSMVTINGHLVIEYILYNSIYCQQNTAISMYIYVYTEILHTYKLTCLC